jgi:hypothetical protein
MKITKAIYLLGSFVFLATGITMAQDAKDNAGNLPCYSECDVCKDACSRASCDACNSSKKKCQFCRDGKLEDPWTLPQPCFLKQNDIKVSGWISAGIFANAFGAAGNGPLGLNNVGDGFTANQLWLYGEKKTATEGCGTDWGFRADYLFGVDGPDTQAFGDRGWDFGWNSARDYGSAIPQLYGEIALNDWTVKGGHFYTPMGYEVLPAPSNFFYSHSYAFSYSEPITHTGFLATRKFGERFSAAGGWVTGWDGGWENKNGASNFLGVVNWNMSDKTTLLWVVCAGHFGDGQFPYVNGATTGNEGEIVLNSLVFTVKLTDKWTYILQNDIADNYSRPNAGDAQWFGIDQYLIYKINDCWSWGGRIEWFRDDDGTRVISGNPGNYNEMTMGVNYKPHANFTFRPEVRYDWFSGETAGGKPFDENSATDQFSGGFDMIFTF